MCEDINAPFISIHAPRTGSDSSPALSLAKYSNFNPRSPHGERRLWRKHRYSPGHFNPRSPHGERQPCAWALKKLFTFQSTLPARGATEGALKPGSLVKQFQSTLPARGATIFRDLRHFTSAFQSTLPARGATPDSYNSVRAFFISIHAPRTGSDVAQQNQWKREYDFNPRSPHGERRRLYGFHCTGKNRFQSTLPARGATRTSTGYVRRDAFQSTLPARGATIALTAVTRLKN